MRFKILLFVLVLAIALLPRLARADAGCGVPVAGPDNWPVATPESVGMFSADLCPMIKWLTDAKENNVHSVLVARHGKLIFEHYFTGVDEHLGRPAGVVTFNAETRHDERSVSKSITGLVTGVAIQRGWIKSIDAPVFSFFPDYAQLSTPEKAQITLRNLLTMSSGIEWHEFMVPYTSKENSEIAMDTSPEPYRFALSQPMAAAPGKIWNYNSGSTELIGEILKKTSGKALDQLARETIFEPLGITDVEWYKYAEDNPSAAAGLRLRPRDLAKIGQLVLQRGNWNGKQLVPAVWINNSITPQIGAFDLNFYGYQFWLGRSLVSKRDVPWASAVGLGGQRLFIVPDYNIVVAINAGLYQSPLQGEVPLKILNQYVFESLHQRPLK